MKKFLSVLVAAMLVLAMGVTAFANSETDCNGGDSCTHEAAIGNTHYDTLKEAVESVTDGTETEIKLLRDVDDGAGIIIGSNKNITIDFCGHYYTVTKDFAGSSGTKNQCFQLLKDSNITLKNGKIASSSAYLESENNNSRSLRMVVQNYSNLTLIDMTLDHSETSYSSNDSYALSNNNGVINITGNTNIIAKQGGVAFDVCWSKSANYSGGAQVTLNTTGTIDGTVEIGVWSNGEDTSDVKSLLTILDGDLMGNIETDIALTSKDTDIIHINGGTFAGDVSKYVPETETVVKTSDGRYRIGTDADYALANAEEGDTIEIIQVAGQINTNPGVNVVNKTNDDITVNGETVAATGTITITAPAKTPVRDTVTIEVGGEKEDDNKTTVGEGEANPSTGAPVFMGAVVGVLASIK